MARCYYCRGPLRFWSQRLQIEHARTVHRACWERFDFFRRNVFEPLAHQWPINPRPVRKVIELWPCGYQALCNVKSCQLKATMIAIGGWPSKRYELCAVHAEQIAERERAKGREIVTREQTITLPHVIRFGV